MLTLFGMLAPALIFSIVIVYTISETIPTTHISNTLPLASSDLNRGDSSEIQSDPEEGVY